MQLLKRPLRVTAAFLIGTAVIAGIACTSERIAGPIDSPTTLIISPSSVRLVNGATAQLSAAALMNTGVTLSPPSVAWSSSDVMRVTVSTNGLLTAVAPGNATITARSGALSATIAIVVEEGGVALPTGSVVAASNGSARLTIPAGAVTTAASIHLDPATTPSTARTVGTAVAVTGEVTSFAMPVLLTLAYPAANESVAADGAGPLPSLYRMVGNAWVPVPGSVTDAVAHTVSAPITSLGTFSLLLPQVVTSVAITLPAATIAEETSQQATAQILDQLSQPMLDTPVAWTSSNPAVAAIGATGTITALRAGTATITASAEGHSATATLTVIPAPVATISLAFASASIPSGSQSMATVVTRSAAGTVLTGRDLTFTSSTPGIATVNSVGVLTGVSAGTATITATSEGKSASVVVTVTPAVQPIATSVVINLPAAAIAEETTQQATAKVLDQFAQPLDAPISWSSSNPLVATIGAADGIITALRAGTTTLSATGGGVSAATPFTVTPAPVATIGLVLSDPSITSGAQTIASATTRSALGTILSGRAVAFSTSAPTVATVNSLGVVTGVSAGVATITATSESQSASATVTVTPLVGGLPARMSIVAGDGQTASAMTSPAVAPAVLVEDASGHPLSNVVVSLAVTAGGGTVKGGATATAQTGTNGIATFVWKMGSRAGANALTASVTGVAPVTFSATATVQLAIDFNIQWVGYSYVGGLVPGGVDVNLLKTEARVTKNTHPVTLTARGGGAASTLEARPFQLGGCNLCWVGSIDLTTVPNGTYWFVFEAADTIGTRVADSVQYTVSHVNTIATTLTNPTLTIGATTQGAVELRDVSGNLQSTSMRPVAWSSSNPSVATVTAAGVVTAVGVGTASISAARDGKSGSATVTVIAPPQAAASLAKVAGDGQTALALRAPAVAPSVLVKDAAGNPMSNVDVTFAVGAGGGTINGSNVVQTGTNGVATLTGWRLGSRPGANTLTATVSGLAPVTFSVTATVELAIDFNIQWVGFAYAGGLVPGNLDVNLQATEARVTKNTHPVTLTARGAGQSSTLAARPFQLGGCQNCWVGSIDLTTVPSGTYWFVFEAVDTIGTRVADSVQYTVVRVNSITTTFENPTLSVGGTTQAAAVLRDVAGTVMSAAAPTLRPVTWSSSNTAVATVNAAGVVTAVSGGTAIISAARDGKTGSATITVSTASGAATLVKTAGDNQTSAALSIPGVPLTVVVKDAAGNPAGNQPVTFVVATGGGTIAGVSVANTNVSGVATFSGWRLGSRPGLNTITASVSGATPVTFSATATVQLALSFNIQWVGYAYPGGLTAGPTDVHVPNTEARITQNTHPVTLTATGAGRTSTLSARPFQLGGCQYCWVGSIDLSTVAPGTYWFVFQATDTIGTTVKDSVQYTVAPHVSTIETSVANPSLQVSSTTQATAVLKDPSGNVLPNNTTTRRPVAWSSSNPAVAVVTSLGIVTAVGPGTAAIRATRDGVTGSASVTVTVAPPSTLTLTKYDGDNQTGVALRQPTKWPSVIVKDAVGNPVAGVLVSFAVVSGGGTITGSPTVLSQFNGIAALNGWQLGPNAGVNTLSAFITGAAPVTFTATGTVTVNVDFASTFEQLGVRDGVDDVFMPSAGAHIVSAPYQLTAATVTAAGQTRTLPKLGDSSCQNCWRIGAFDLTSAPSGTYWFVFEGIDEVGTRGADSVQFTLPAHVATITTTIASATPARGTTTQATAVLRDGAGNVLPTTAPTRRPVIWASSNTSVAAVSTTGIVTATGAGTATITASREGKSGSVSVTVLP